MESCWPHVAGSGCTPLIAGGPSGAVGSGAEVGVGVDASVPLGSEDGGFAPAATDARPSGVAGASPTSATALAHAAITVSAPSVTTKLNACSPAHSGTIQACQKCRSPRT